MARGAKSSTTRRRISSTTIISTENGTPLLLVKTRPSFTTFKSSSPKVSAASPKLSPSGAATTVLLKSNNPALTADYQKHVLASLISKKKFSPSQAVKIAKSFLKLNFSPTYYKRFGPAIVANHAIAVAVAALQQNVLGNGQNGQNNGQNGQNGPNNGQNGLFVAIENNPSLLGADTTSFYLTDATNLVKIAEIEARIAKTVGTTSPTNGYSIETFTSQDGKKKLFFTQSTAYPNPSTIGKPLILAENQRIDVDIVKTIALPAFSQHYLACPFISSLYVQSLATLQSEPLSPVISFHPSTSDNHTTAIIGYTTHSIVADNTTSQNQLLSILAKENNLSLIKKSTHTFSNNVIIITATFYTPSDDAAFVSFKQQLVNTFSVPHSTILTPALVGGSITINQYIYLSLLTKVLFYAVASNNSELSALIDHFDKNNDNLNVGKLRSLYLTTRREAITEDRLQTAFLKYPVITAALADDFTSRQSREFGREGYNGDKNTQIVSLVKKSVPTIINTIDQDIFLLALLLNEKITKSNIYTDHAKQALALRIEGDFFACMDLPRAPFCVFFVLGGLFQGLHVRFADVARGGIRLIIPRDETMYNKAKLTQFQESFNLAFTQNLKNKDIPEFGSKGTVLLHPSAPQSQGLLSFERYINSLLDLLIPQDGVEGRTMVNNYGKNELLFLGPDEGTAGVMKWAALRAKKRGYSYWRAFTTGKPAILGGIPHDVYGMTTNSVHRFVLGSLAKLNMNESEITKAQTAGPDGDLGSNEIKISKDNTIVIVDGSGVLYDPKGINRVELTSLATRRVMSKEFDMSKLSPEGFFVSVDDKDVVLPDGEIVTDGTDFRNNFHLNKRFTADLFVPCGGRPEAVNLSNVNRLFKEDGTPKFKVIIEGANLFFSQDARFVLENAGVVLYKDASTNKGGVTSSSLEVLAALALPADVFETKMAVHDKANPPVSYEKYAFEIRDRIIQDADLEFECIWREHERTGLPRYVLTDKISNKINDLNDEIHASDLFEQDIAVQTNVLKALLPHTLQDIVGFETLMATAPMSYLKASFTAFVASHFVYEFGLDTTKEQFDTFIAKYRQ